MVSIIIPTLNRANHLLRTITSIYAVPVRDNVEIIVVDNGSTDGTRSVCDSFSAHTPQLVYLYDPMPGLLTGRHRGASVAQGDILCFLDDDVRLESTWLDSVKSAFQHPEVQLATGPSWPEFEVHPPAWLKYFWHPESDGGKSCPWLSLLDLGSTFKDIHPNYVWGLNFCIRKQAFQTLGGFHPDCIPADLQMFQGDGETGLTLKAHARGFRAVYHPGIKLYHLVTAERLTTEYFKRRAFYQGVCNSFTHLRNKALEQQEGMAALTRQGLKTKLTGFVKSAITRFSVPEGVRELQHTLAAEELKGYNYHQCAYTRMSTVKEWVEKMDYWDFSLPTPEMM